ncbi:MAG: hypothetical protein DRI91_04510, partial [Aquificota bacterium]
MENLKIIIKAWLRGKKPILSGVWDSLLGFILYTARKSVPFPPLVVVPEDRGEELYTQLAAFQPTVFIPPWDSDPSSGVPPSSQVLRKRMTGLYQLLETSPVVVTTLRGLA